MKKRRASKLMTISLPPSLYRDALKTAKQEGRTNSELARESIRRYIADKKWRELLAYGRQRAAQTGVKPEDIEGLVDELRS